MAENSVLVVDDDEDVSSFVELHLKREGFVVQTSDSAEDCLERVRAGNFSLFMLDLMLPGVSGLELCKKLKSDLKTRDTPIIMLTAMSSDEDVVQGLELGADDYITKPFNPKVLVARTKAVLRRRQTPAASGADSVQIADLEIVPELRVVKVQGAEVRLEKSDYDLLWFFVRNRGRILLPHQIASALKLNRGAEERIASLRDKLGPSGSYIEYIVGIGYRLRDDI